MAEYNESPEERQENELQVLKAVFMGDCKDTRDDDTWKVQRPLEVIIHLLPLESMGGESEVHTTIDMKISCTQQYPEEVPEVTFENAKGLSNEQVKGLKKRVDQEAKKLIGEVMVLDLAQIVQQFLHDHNKPQMKSFYHEMLSNKKRKEEKAAKEEQKKLDFIKKKQEIQRKQIEEEIQRRQEDLKEENRRRRELMNQEEDKSATKESQSLDQSEDVTTQHEQTSGPKTQSPTLSQHFSPTRRKRQPDPVDTDDRYRARQSSLSRTRHDSDAARRDISSSGLMKTTFYTKGERDVTRGNCVGMSGSGGRMYVALDCSTGELVAICEWVLKWRHSRKSLSLVEDSDREKVAQYMKQVISIEQELHSLLRLEHEGLLHYLAIKYADMHDSIKIEVLQEYDGGCSLVPFIENGIVIPPETLRHYSIDILEALQYLHSKGVVHKDLKAASVFIDSEGRLRLADYSIGKRLSDLYYSANPAKQAVRFNEDKVVGRGGKKGDILKFGMLLLSLTQGDFITEYPFTIPNTLPQKLQDFIAKSVDKDDRARFSAQQLLNHAFILQPDEDNGAANGVDTGVESSTGNEGTNEGLTLDMRFATPKPIDPSKSRLYSEFEELQWLGKGGFGDVIKVRNKLDDCFYAIKRIPLNPKSKEFNKKITREVKLLSRLNHENVVRYYNSWIELCENAGHPSSGSESRTDTESQVNGLDEVKMNLRNSLSSDEVEQLAPKPVEGSQEWSTSFSFEATSRSGIVQEESTDTDCSSDEEDVFGRSFMPYNDSDSDSDIVFESSFRNSNFVGIDYSDFCEESKGNKGVDERNERSESPMGIQYLYIQMEYCEKSTLRNSIDDMLCQDNKRVWRLFREILEGLAHIHLQGMIHRDLKPVNIFLDLNDHVKIGDFGLATTHAFAKLGMFGESAPSEPTSPDRSQEGTGERYTGKVGTALYVSPELQNGKAKSTYNQKVDLYSLGIIFFEMCFPPLKTGMERVQVLGNVRQESIQFPEEFDELQNPDKMHVIRWLLNHDPSKRPTAQELLQSPYMPPPEMEDAQLHEVLRHTMSNKQSSAYRRLLNEIFSQSVTAAADCTYDIDIMKTHSTCQPYLAQRTAYETVCRIFQKHGGVKVNTALLLPKSEMYESNDLCTSLMDTSGALVSLPYDLRVPFARFVARKNITFIKRYSIERVYRARKLFGAHPREVTECAFDIVTNTLGTLFPDAEVLHVVSEIINEIPALQGHNYVIKLNHAKLLKAILVHCGIPVEKHQKVYDIINDVKNEKLTIVQIKTRLCSSLSISNEEADNLYKHINYEGPYSKVNQFLKPITKGKGPNASQAKQGLHELDAVISHAQILGIKLLMEISLGLVYNAQFFCGVMFRFSGEVVHKKKKTIMDVLAVGGRYDKLINHFKVPITTTAVTQVQHAVGVSIAFDKLVSAVQEETESIPSVIDILVCVVGSKPLFKERIKVVRDLWAAGLRADMIYDSTMSWEEIQDYCKEECIPHLVMLKDVESGNVKVHVKSFDTERGVIEKKVMLTELVDYFQQKFQTAKIDLSESCQMYGQKQTNYPAQYNAAETNTANSSNTLPDFKVSYIILEKIPNNVKRRIEGQMMSIVTPVLQQLSPRTNVEVIGVDLTISVLQAVSTLVGGIKDEDDDDDYEMGLTTMTEKNPKIRKYLIKVCDSLRELKTEKKIPVLILYTYKEDRYQVIF
ncbi:eIF-2-alpha kinase GCN2-like [Glandiceps talaboti]